MNRVTGLSTSDEWDQCEILRFVQSRRGASISWRGIHTHLVCKHTRPQVTASVLVVAVVVAAVEVKKKRSSPTWM